MDSRYFRWIFWYLALRIDTELPATNQPTAGAILTKLSVHYQKVCDHNEPDDGCIDCIDCIDCLNFNESNIISIHLRMPQEEATIVGLTITSSDGIKIEVL